MKHYELEPQRKYREIERRGLHAWNELHGEPGFDFSLHPFLDRVLPTIGFKSNRPAAIEIGCGTGACCFLAQRNFDVTGLDVSPKAIELARRFAAERGLRPNYEVADVCRRAARPSTFDLVIDGHCLECIALDDDRQAVFAAVRRMLREDGYYIVGTTVWNPRRDYAGSYVDERGIVFLPVANAPDFDDAVKIGDSWYLPNRRHLTPDRLRDELIAAGFSIRLQVGGDLLCSPASRTS